MQLLKYIFLNFIYLFWLRWVFLCCVGLSLDVKSRGSLSSYSTWASHYSGFSCFRAQAPGCSGSVLWLPGSRAQAQSWHMVLVAPQHMGSSRIRDQTRVSCIGKWIFYH